jgi:hypothetical protein
MLNASWTTLRQQKSGGENDLVRRNKSFPMDLVLQAFKDYGWGVAVIFFILYRYKDFIGAIASRIIPSWAEKKELERHQREMELERLKQERLDREKERIDAITVQRDMLLAQRSELDAEKRERRETQQVLYDFVGKYERFAAQNIEVMRDLSDLVRTDLARVRELTELVRSIVEELNGRDRRYKDKGEEPPRPIPTGIEE